MRIASDTFRFTALIGFLVALPALSIDISAPTLVNLQTDLKTTTTVAGLTLSVFMVGFALGQAAGGTLSDRHGRRPLLLSGLVAYAAAAVGCALSASAAALVAFRFVQGLGAGTCAVLAFAIVEDLFEGDAARSKRSYVTVVFGITPVLAPALGALLSNRAGWRSVHAVLATAGLALLAVIWSGLPESRPAGASRPASQPDAKTPLALWKDDRFIGLAAVNALSYGCVFAYIAGSPVVVIGLMGLPTTTYAALFASTALALTSGAWISGKLSRRGVGAGAMVRAQPGAFGPLGHEPLGLEFPRLHPSLPTYFHPSGDAVLPRHDRAQRAASRRAATARTGGNRFRRGRGVADPGRCLGQHRCCDPPARPGPGGGRRLHGRSRNERGCRMVVDDPIASEPMTP